MAGAQSAQQSARAFGSSVATRFRGVRESVRRRPGGPLLWRVGVTTLGVLVVAGGIVLLPLPGPGWLIIFAGLGLLATEYTWAQRLLRFARDQVGRWTRWLMHQPLWVRAGVVLLTAAFVGAVLYAVYVLFY